MNIIGKLIGLIAFVFIILLLVNFRVVLPVISTLMFGGNGVSTVEEITAEYIRQIEAIYPIPESMYSSGARARAYTYGTLRSYAVPQNKNISNIPDGQVRVVAEKIGSTLMVTTANLILPQNLQGVAHVWIANTPTISDATTYIDIGLVKNGGIQTYRVDVGPGNLSLQEYRYVMVVNPSDFSIYSQATLQ
jgi:hypothetical protein